MSFSYSHVKLNDLLKTRLIKRNSVLTSFEYNDVVEMSGAEKETNTA